MKKLFLLAFLLSWLAIGASAQTYVLTVTEVDGTPRKTGITTLVFSNGSLTISGSRAIVNTGGGGGTVGQPVVGGGNNRVLYTDGSGNLKTTANFAYVETSGALVVTPSTVGTGILVQGGASPINGLSNLGTNVGLFEFGIASGVAAFTPLAIPGDGIVRASSVTGGNGNLIFINNNSAFTGAFIWSTGALGADTEKFRIGQTGAITSTVSSATAHCVGPNGCTNPAFNIVTNVASAATGVQITGNAAGTAATITATSSGGNESVSLVPKGTGNVIIGLNRLQFGGTATSAGNSAIDTSGTTVRFVTGSASAFVPISALNVLIPNATVGTSGSAVLAMLNGTAPTSSPADEFQMYSADSAAGNANAYIRNELGEITRLTGLNVRNTAQFDKTSDTTLANITGITRDVEAGRVYDFVATLETTSNASGGVKAAISGTATATSITYSCFTTDSGTTVQTRATALGTACGGVTAVTAATIVIRGTIVVNAAGTLTVQFAQNASNGTASSVLANAGRLLLTPL